MGKKKRGNTKKAILDEEDEDFMASSQRTKTDVGDSKLVLTKDNPFTIFHALGKFLYNKRINPQTKKVEQLPYELMRRERKPELYFRHKDILN